MATPLTNLKVLFAGSGAFGVPSLNRLRDSGASLVRIYTQPDKPAGRGHMLTPTPVGKWAVDRGVELVRTDDLNRETLPQADLLVVIAFGQKLAPRVVDHARLGAVNLHASRLPRYRGAAPINWAVISGDATTGNSVIRLAQKMDAGAVLAMSEIAIGETETAGEVHDRLSADGAGLIERVAMQLRDGTATPIEQDHSLASKAPKLSRDASIIDWTRDARSVANQIRGMHPWPGCRVQLLQGEEVDHKVVDRLTLIRARPVSESMGALPGALDTRRRLVQCGHQTSIELLEVHPDGRRPISVVDYLRGRKTEDWMQLVSGK